MAFDDWGSLALRPITSLLEVNGWHLWRGERHLLKGLGFTLSAGELLQLLWSNGTGKTSLLRSIAGILQPEAGELRWQGEPVKQDRSALLRDLAYQGHELALKPGLTPLENLTTLCELRGGRSPSEIVESLRQNGLPESHHRQRLATLSAGQQRRVALTRLSLWRASLWLLDEPAANLDAAGQQVLTARLAEHLQSGGCALVATHLPLEVPGAQVRRWLSPEQVI